jgi:hypothetical protein
MTNLAGSILFLMLPKEQLEAVPKVTERRKAGKKGKKSSASQKNEKKVAPKPTRER